MSLGSHTSRVYLLRHARAAWAGPGERDFDRALDPNGRSEASRIATIMALNGFVPARVLCSPARRCRETWEAVEGAFSRRFDVRFSLDLYTRDHDAYVDLIAETSGPSVLVVGHNPMMDDTARALVRSDGAAFEGPLARGFPTGGLAIVDLAGELASAREGTARLSGFLVPQDG